MRYNIKCLWFQVKVSTSKVKDSHKVRESAHTCCSYYDIKEIRKKANKISQMITLTKCHSSLKSISMKCHLAFPWCTNNWEKKKCEIRWMRKWNGKGRKAEFITINLYCELIVNQMCCDLFRADILYQVCVSNGFQSLAACWKREIWLYWWQLGLVICIWGPAIPIHDM